MILDAYTLPLNSHLTFVCGDKEISGQHWAEACIDLAYDISAYPEKNWLLYQDDFYQYSLYFFALLLADKNIVLAQSEQYDRFKQASLYADISIGSISGDAFQNHDVLLPHFQRLVNKPLVKNQEDAKKIELSTDSNAPFEEGLTSIKPNTMITLFTSGSTGEAKAIKKYWYQLANEVKTLESLFGNASEQSCIVATVTHKHIYGLLFKLLWPVFTHQKIICDTIEYPEQVEEYSQSFTNIRLISSPSYLTRTSEDFSLKVSDSVQQIFCSGGPLSYHVANTFFVSNEQAITEIYGSTETGGIAWRRQSDNEEWLLFPEHQVTLTTDTTLLLSSPFLAENSTYKTDDSVALNGRFFSLLGRVDRIVKLHEKRLSLDEMEQTLNQLAYVSACHCFMLDKSKNKPALVAVIELKHSEEQSNNSTEKKKLVKGCKSALLTVFEPSLLPRKWRFVEQLPFNSQGKLVKAELENLFL